MNHEIISGGEKPPFEYKYFKDAAQRYELARKAAQLMLLVEHLRSDNLIFLDKGARPLNALFLDIWERARPGIPHPKINFLQIGSETISEISEANTDLKENAINLVYGEEINRIKKDYAYLKDLPRGATAIIVDDFSASGKSMAMAHKILRIAFPNLNIKDFVFAYAGDRLFSEIYTSQNQSGPPWRDVEEKSYITGVIDAKKKLTSRPARKENGSRIDIDELREELHRIADEFMKETRDPDLIRN
jgi:hypothetical protein